MARKPREIQPEKTDEAEMNARGLRRELGEKVPQGRPTIAHLFKGG
jgi:hypothetical protein